MASKTIITSESMAQQNMLALASSIATNTPVLMWGAPGIGKTALIQALADLYQIHLEVVIASIREPADFSGLPVIDHSSALTKVTMAPPSWAHRLVEAVNEHKTQVTGFNQWVTRALLFLDEITTAPPAVQAALLRVVLDRVVGDLELPQGLAIVAAANPPDQAAGGWELSPPLANRFAHLDWHIPSAQAWNEGMLKGWPTPEIPRIGDWEKQLPLAKGLVSSYLNTNSGKLHNLPQDSSQQGKAWPSPRSWEMATRMLAAGLTVTRDDGALAHLVGSCVGQGIGVEFASLIGGDILPNPEELLKNPEKAELPTRADKLLVAMNAVVAYLSSDNNLTTTNWINAWKLMNKAHEDRPTDVVAVAAKSLALLWNTNLHDQTTKPLPIPTEYMRPFSQILKQVGIRMS